VRRVSYSVLFRQFPLDQLDALAPLVAQTFGINDYDARTKIRKGWGFLERGATEQDARRIVEAMGDLAGGVVAIDNTQLLTLADPKVMTRFDAVPNGMMLVLQSPQEPTRLVEWSELSVVAAGRVSEDILVRESGGNERTMGKMMMGLGVFLVTGIPTGIFGGKKKKDAKPVKSSRVITFGRIVTTVGEQFAFNPDHFDFSGLAEKKQMNMGEFSRVARRVGSRVVGESEPGRAPRAREPLDDPRQLHRPPRLRDRIAVAGECRGYGILTPGTFMRAR